MFVPAALAAAAAASAKLIAAGLLKKFDGTSNKSSVSSLAASSRTASNAARVAELTEGVSTPFRVASDQHQVARGTTSCRRAILTEQPRSVVRNFRGVLRDAGRSRITCTTAAARRGHCLAAAACKQYRRRLSKVNQHASPRRSVPSRFSIFRPSSALSLGCHRMISIGGNGTSRKRS